MLFGCVYLVSINSVTFPLETLGFIRPAETYAFNYYLYASSFVFFGGGALSYHLYKEKVEVHYFAALGTILLLSFTQTIMPFWHLFFIALAIPPLFNYTAKNRIDRVIGELSYPAYILHFPVLLFLRPYAASITNHFYYINLGTLVAIVSCILGLLLYFSLEKKVDKYRNSEGFFPNKTSLLGKPYTNIATKAALLGYLFFPILSICYINYDQKFVVHQRANNFTDINWNKGIGRSWAGFFVDNTAENLERYKIGSKVKFVTGDIREIVQVLKGESFVNIYLTGEPLNGLQVGYPNEIEAAE